MTVHTEQSHYREKSIKRFPSLPLTHFCVSLIQYHIHLSHSLAKLFKLLNIKKKVLNNFFILRTFFIFGRRYFVIYCILFTLCIIERLLCVLYVRYFSIKKRNTKMAMRMNFQVMLIAWHYSIKTCKTQAHASRNETQIL